MNDSGLVKMMKGKINELNGKIKEDQRYIQWMEGEYRKLKEEVDNKRGLQ